MLNHILTHLNFFCKSSRGKNYEFIRIRSAADTAEIRSRGISDNAENRQSIKISLKKGKGG